MINIQHLLVKFFGGYTEKEMSLVRHESIKAGIVTGASIARNDVKSKMESLYGTPADEWCKEMYSFLCKDFSVEFNNKEDDEKDKEH